MKNNIVVFVSGKGSNARNIDRYFRENYGFGISTLVSSRPNEELENWASEKGITYIQTDKNLKTKGIPIWEMPAIKNTDLIVLAGFLKKIPSAMLSSVQVPIINIHPSLLPKYGGHGMYGSHVHRAVLDAGETESGITIHHVNENYDEGNIILQKETVLSPDETIESLMQKIHLLEYKHYPEVIELLLRNGSD